MIDLDFVITPESIQGDDLVINLNLENVLELKSPAYHILNPKINLKLPKKTFPSKQDTIGFEYELLTYEEPLIELSKQPLVYEVKQQAASESIQNHPIILRVQLFDTLFGDSDQSLNERSLSEQSSSSIKMEQLLR